MGDSKALTRKSLALATAALVAASLGLACTTVKLKLRKPGIQHAAFASELKEECKDQALPFFSFETNELVPRYVKPGDELNHRLVYILCPSVPTEVVAGKLVTRILHQAKPVTTEEIAFGLEEGRWVIDTFITLPPNAPPGAYALDLRFSSKKGNLSSTVPFVVEAQ